MDRVVEHNRAAWNREAQLGNPATIAVSDAQMESARHSLSGFSMTDGRALPPHWLEGLKGSSVLCLALGGGQQVPLLAAAGARVTSLDISDVQLERDFSTARRFELDVECVIGDMQDAELLKNRVFDFVFVGPGLQFLPSPEPVWANAARWLRPDGRLIAAVVNPTQYLFEWPSYSKGEFKAVHALPYSDLDSLTPEGRAEIFNEQDPIEFGHTFEQMLGGLCEAGFSIKGFFEDKAASDPFSKVMATFFVINATRTR